MDKPIRAIEGKCLHYNGTVNPCCDAGVNYELLADGGKPLFDVLPCFGKGKDCEKHCEKKLLPTKEQVKAWKDYTDERFTKIFEARDLIIKQNEKDKRGKGFVNCPACSKGRLYYSVASYNGHVHASCETQECLQWME